MLTKFNKSTFSEQNGWSWFTRHFKSSSI